MRAEQRSCFPVSQKFHGLEPAAADSSLSTALLSEPAAADRLGIGFGWLQNAWLLHARLKIHRGALIPVCG
jgi:hypothetical protein